MEKPTIPSNEKERLENLLFYEIMDSELEKEFDEITMLASTICGCPISLVSLIDEHRQWFKSHFGLETTETPKDWAFCAHAINEPNDIFEIENAFDDKRFYDNPLVIKDPNVVFYAGIPLVTKEGFPLGTLCVIDHKPKKLNENQRIALNALGNQTIRILELRKSKITLEATIASLKAKNVDLERFAYVAAHDIRSPLANITSLIQMMIEEHKDSINDDMLKTLHYIEMSASDLSCLVQGIFEYTFDDKILKEQSEKIEVPKLFERIDRLVKHGNDVDIQYTNEVPLIYTNIVLVEQIMKNLIENAIKYSDKEKTIIKVRLSKENNFYKLTIEDNGVGIPENKLQDIFKLFQTVSIKDKFGHKGTGIGLATVDKLIHKINGKIEVQSTLNIGTTFTIYIPEKIKS